MQTDASVMVLLAFILYNVSEPTWISVLWFIVGVFWLVEGLMDDRRQDKPGGNL